MSAQRQSPSKFGMVKRGLELAQIGRAALNWRKATDAKSRQAAQQALALRLGQARGLPMKVGQFLAVSGDEAFAQLTQSIDPLDLEIIVGVLEAAWGTNINNVLSDLAPSRAAASLGQVHCATLRGGEQVAIKVRYPDILQHVQSELALTGLLPNLGPGKKWGFDLDSYKNALREGFERELDYLDEARRQAEFAQRNKVEGLIVPQVDSTWCRSDVLVQAWHEGVRLEAIRQANVHTRTRIAEILCQTLFQSAFCGGLVHADPHPGNYLFHDAPKPAVVLLDYGATISISASRSIALLKLLSGSTIGKPAATLDALYAIGFDAVKLGYLKEEADSLAQLLSAPFTTSGKFDPRTWQLSERMDATLGEKKWWFRSAGPADLFLLIRAFHGLLAQLEQLDVTLSWQEQLRIAVGQNRLDHAKRYLPPEMPENPARSELQPNLRANAVEAVEAGEPTRPTQAAHLKVAVYERESLKVSLAMPATSARSLCDIIPLDVIEKLTAHGISLEELQTTVDRSELAAQVIFKLTDGDKRYEVWLE